MASTLRHRFGWGVCLLAGIIAGGLALAGKPAGAGTADAPSVSAGWTSAAARDEIRPEFSVDPKGGPEGQGALVIRADARKGLDGYWLKSFPVTGGKYYRFEARYRATNVAVPRRSVLVRLRFLNADGQPVPVEDPKVVAFYTNAKPMTEPEFPMTETTDASGWTKVSDYYLVPPKATQAKVELHLQWAPQSEVRWSDVSLKETAPPEPRKVRLATIHFNPSGGKTPAENCRMFAPMIADAGRQKADLVVLGEVVNNMNLKKKYEEVAEPVPGPATEYFGTLARQNDLYIVVGLLERDGRLIYNTAALIGPDGKLVGKYHKVCLPYAEVEGGITPGSDYPVFDTRFGKLGMMICYDGFFPEPARELSNRGAEVIAWPVWGCNPLLARARACENHVYVVSSTYIDAADKWMLSAVYDHQGEPIAQAKQWGSVAVAEVDLNQRTKWCYMNDFKAELFRHRPVVEGR